MDLKRMKQRCPRCGSEKIERYEEDLPFIRCLHCGYDELGPEVLPYDVRKTQREKGKFTPYKTGGKGRVQKE